MEIHITKLDNGWLVGYSKSVPVEETNANAFISETGRYHQLAFDSLDGVFSFLTTNFDQGE